MKEYSVWLSMVKHVSNRKKYQLLAAFGSAEAVCRASSVELASAVSGLTSKDIEALSDDSMEEAEDICRACRRIGAEVIDPCDDIYPALLRHISDPPAVLYVRGDMPDMENSIAVGIVGQRKATISGMKNASSIAYELSKNGVIVVSGLAAGIDGAAHRGALDGGSPTVAVLGTAIGKCYPAENAGLMRRIMENGAVISEYPPGSRTYSGSFLMRNRIISGMCRGLLVVEAREKSGSLVTARRAAEQDRDIFAVPGPIDSDDYVGTNGLIKDGAAVVTSAADILGAYGYVPEKRAARPARQKREPDILAETAGTSRGEAAIPEGPDGEIIKAIGKIAHIDEIADRTKMETGELLARLTMLEIQGMVVQRPGNYFEIKR